MKKPAVKHPPIPSSSHPPRLSIHSPMQHVCSKGYKPKQKYTYYLYNLNTLKFNCSSTGFLWSVCCKMLKTDTKLTSASWIHRSARYRLKDKFNKPHLNLHHQFPKIQNKPQKQSAFPERKKKKAFCLHNA